MCNPKDSAYLCNVHIKFVTAIEGLWCCESCVLLWVSFLTLTCSGYSNPFVIHTPQLSRYSGICVEAILKDSKRDLISQTPDNQNVSCIACVLPGCESWFDTNRFLLNLKPSRQWETCFSWSLSCNVALWDISISLVRLGDLCMHCPFLNLNRRRFELHRIGYFDQHEWQP